MRGNSPFANDTISFSESLHSNNFSTRDEVSSQASNLSRPSAKAVYKQRKEYAASINKMLDKFQYRVEHLFTCELDGKDLRNTSDCVERLKLLDGMGRVWGQNMVLDLRGADLVLTDIETKEELESLSLSDVGGIQSVLDGGAFNSLLMISVQSKRKPHTSVFLFQCDDLRADLLEKHLTQALCRRHELSSYRSSSMGSPPPPQDEPVLLWTAPDYEDDITESEMTLQEEDESYLSREPTPVPHFTPTTTEEEDERLAPPEMYSELNRDVDILNHILGDIEIFIGKISAVVAKNGKKKKKKKKGRVMDGMPSAEEFAVCLRKIKSGFNLLGELNGKIHNPSAPDFVHSLFSALGYVVAHCPEGLPATILAPVLSSDSVHLMSEEVSEEEEKLWQSLGEAWNTISTAWAEAVEDIPTYNPEFFDGWQPPEVSAVSEPNDSMAGRETPIHASPRWRPPRHSQTKRSGEPQYLLVMYDFSSRNQRELSITKGETVELLDQSRQWWKVRNGQGEEGYVPNNVLQSLDEQADEEIHGPPVLTKRSKPAEVKAWLEDKGFTKITVRCLAVLSGLGLLNMTREELKTLCPEEGGRVFYQLQSVKSALAAAE